MGSRLAFIGLERIGGIMVFNIDDPKAPKWLSYANNRNFGVPANNAEAGDLGLSGLLFIPESGSPVKKPLVVSANEVSGTITIFSFGELTDVEEADIERTPWRLYPNPVAGELFTNTSSDYEVYNTLGHLLLRSANTNRIDVQQLPAGTYLLRDSARNRSKLFVKQ